MYEIYFIFYVKGGGWGDKYVTKVNYYLLILDYSKNMLFSIFLEYNNIKL